MSKLYFNQCRLIFSCSTLRTVLLVLACVESAAAASLNNVPVQSSASCDSNTGIELLRSIQQITTTVPSDAQTTRVLDNVVEKVSQVPDTCNFKAMMLTELSLQQFHRGQLRAAMRSAQNALRLNTNLHSLSAMQAGMNSYLLGGAYASLGRYDESREQYLQSVRQFSRLGTEGLPMIIHVYSDLAVMWAGEGSLDKAEYYLQKGVKIEQRTNGLRPAEIALNHDALAHVLFLRGRTSDAMALLASMIKDYADNPALPVRFRGHLYRDYGQVCLALQQFDRSITNLKKAVALEEGQSALPDLEMTETLIAQAYAAEKDYAAAETEFDHAARSVIQIERNFPAEAAEVIGSYGVFLNSRKRWDESRPLLEHALALAESASSDTETQARCLAQLAEADHHLHKGKEARALRKRAKMLAAQMPVNREQENTVDVSALKQAYAKTDGK